MAPPDPLWAVGVPGIREWRPGADHDAVTQERAAQWRQALDRAMSRGALVGRGLRPVHVRVVLYGDRLYLRRTPIAQGVVNEIAEDDLQGPGSLLEPAVVGLLRDLTGESLPLAALHAWAKAVRLGPGAALRYAQAHLADITTYLSCRDHLTPGAAQCPRCARRSDIREAVAQAIADADGSGTPAEVVIGRDLGAVIAYEALCRPSLRDAGVRLLLTVGAPLALASVRDRLDPASRGGGVGTWPAVEKWIDIRTPTDALRGAGGAGAVLSAWFPGVTDRVVDDGQHGLSHDDAYLNCDAVGEILRGLGR